MRDGPLAEVRKYNREHYPCKIKGCGYTSQRGGMCRKHRAMIPVGMIIKGVSEGITASYTIAKKHQRRQLAYVRKLLAAQETES